MAEVLDRSKILHTDSSGNLPLRHPTPNISDSGSITATTATTATTSTTSTVEDVTATHLANLQVFLKDLKTSTEDILRKSKLRYTKVTALVVCWPEALSDRKHISSDAQELCGVLQEEYGFDVKPYTISAQDPNMEFDFDFSNLVRSLQKTAIPQEKPQDPTSLFILYYGGHAILDSNALVWVPSLDTDPSSERKVNWSNREDLLATLNMDILLLMDCCYSGNVINTTKRPTFKQRCEALCACGPMQKASGIPQQSFTRALTNELREHAHFGRACDITYLHSVLNLSSKKKMYGLEVHPWWHDYAMQKNKRVQTSICVARLGTENTTHKLHETQLQAVSKARVIFKASFSNPEVLPILTEWESFIRHRPQNIEDIQWSAESEAELYCICETNSFSAIFSVPLIVWDWLPQRPAYEFICITRTRNLLVQIAPSPNSIDDPSQMQGWKSRSGGMKQLALPEPEPSVSQEPADGDNTSLLRADEENGGEPCAKVEKQLDPPLLPKPGIACTHLEEDVPEPGEACTLGEEDVTKPKGASSPVKKDVSKLERPRTPVEKDVSKPERAIQRIFKVPRNLTDHIRNLRRFYDDQSTRESKDMLDSSSIDDAPDSEVMEHLRNQAFNLYESLRHRRYRIHYRHQGTGLY